MTFDNRHQAGVLLADLVRLEGADTAYVLGLARGGVVVAHALALSLKLPLDVLVVKKISAPHEPELAIGALAPGNVSYVDRQLALGVGADQEYIGTQINRLADQIKEKTALYRKGKKPLTVRDQTVILVDDGVATGATLEVAIRWVHKKRARAVIAAIPVVPADVASKMKSDLDALIFLESPDQFGSVGQFYKDFPQVGDAEVVELLNQ